MQLSGSRRIPQVPASAPYPLSLRSVCWGVTVSPSLEGKPIYTPGLTILQKTFHAPPRFICEIYGVVIYAPDSCSADRHLTTQFICSRCFIFYLRTSCICSRCTYTASVIFNRCGCTYLMHALPIRYRPIYNPQSCPTNITKSIYE